jgi:hypothetical protein
MAVLRVDAREFALYHHRLAQQHRPVLLRGIRAGAQRVVSYMIERTRKAPPANPGGIGGGGAVNTGEFVRRWKAHPLSDGAVVTNDDPKGPVIEHGRRAGKAPPLEMIATWALRRLGLSEEESKRVAFPIAMAIRRRGLLGRKIMTAPEAQTRIEYLVRNEMIHELDRELRRRP